MDMHVPRVAVQEDVQHAPETAVQVQGRATDAPQVQVVATTWGRGSTRTVEDQGASLCFPCFSATLPWRTA